MNLLEIKYLAELCNSILTENNSDTIKQKLEYLFKFYNVINFDLGATPDKLVFRARKCDCIGFNNISDMCCPPAKITKAGRLNTANKPILYLTQNAWSAFDEIGVTDGDFAQIITYSYINKPRLAIIGEIERVFRKENSSYSPQLTQHIRSTFEHLGTSNMDAMRSYIYTDAFLSNILKSNNAKDNNYIHTMHLSEIIFNKYVTIDGIMYDGIESNGAINIALKESSQNSHLKAENCYIFKINKKYGYGIYDHTMINRSNSIDDFGNIVWSDHP